MTVDEAIKKNRMVYLSGRYGKERSVEKDFPYVKDMPHGGNVDLPERLPFPVSLKTETAGNPPPVREVFTLAYEMSGKPEGKAEAQAGPVLYPSTGTIEAAPVRREPEEGLLEKLERRERLFSQDMEGI